MYNLNKNFLPTQYNRGPIRRVVRTGYYVNAFLGVAVITFVGVCVHMNNKDKDSLDKLDGKIAEINRAVQTEKNKVRGK